MPIYDYRCDECGHRFSAVQSFTDAALDKCPNCGKRPRRIITAPGIVFKGSGWYKTDSRPASKDGDGAAPAEKKDTKAETKSETKSDVKSDSRPSGDSASKTKTSDAS